MSAVKYDFKSLISLLGKKRLMKTENNMKLLNIVNKFSKIFHIINSDKKIVKDYMKNVDLPYYNMDDIAYFLAVNQKRGTRGLDRIEQELNKKNFQLHLMNNHFYLHLQHN